MAELVTLARPYARAAFEHAKKNEQVSSWAQMLRLMAEVTQSAKIQNLIVAPWLSNLEKTRILLEICGSDFTEQASNFIKLLAEAKRLILLPQIADLFSLYQTQLESTIKVTVFSAFALTQAQQKSVSQALKVRLNQAIDLIVVQDKKLIGGLVIKADNLVIDGSIRSKLAKLAETLKSNF